jgi:hypothetical protein
MRLHGRRKVFAKAKVRGGSGMKSVRQGKTPERKVKSQKTRQWSGPSAGAFACPGKRLLAQAISILPTL